MIAAFVRSTRVVAMIAAGFVLAALSTEGALASSRLCRQLEAELASMARTPHSTARVRKYDIAMDKQREEMRKARSLRLRAGCSRSLFGGGSSECAGLNAKMERMERNLEALRRKRNQFSGKGSDRARARIMASLDANRCRDEKTANGSPLRGIDRNADLLGQIFGGSQERPLPQGLDEDQDDKHVRRLPDPLEATGGGRSVFVTIPPLAREFRTLCVRTCDGYFFPMSPASSLGDFDRDQKACEASCPGTDVRLYFHRAVGEKPHDMISSASGVPYSRLPTAYIFKKPEAPRPAGCDCNAQRNFTIIGGNPSGQTATPESERQSVEIPAADRKVRVVGPSFLPDPEEAIDLRAPAPKQAR